MSYSVWGLSYPEMVRKAIPQAWCSRAEGLIPYSAELSTGDSEEQAAGTSEGAGGGFWYDQFSSVLSCDQEVWLQSVGID